MRSSPKHCRPYRMAGSQALRIMIAASCANASASRIRLCHAFLVAPSHSTISSIQCANSVLSQFHIMTAPLFSTNYDDLVTTIAPNMPSIHTAPPSPTPKAIFNHVFQTDTRPIILFDGVCNLCNNAVNLAIDWDPNATLRFAALQSSVGKSLLQYHGRDANDISSIVLVTKNGAYVKSDAILGIAESLNPFHAIVPRFLIPSNRFTTDDDNFLTMRPLAKLASTFVPKYLRDLIYDGVADNRYSIMGKRMECRYDADGEFDGRFVRDDDVLSYLDNAIIDSSSQY